ncbi:MAG: shikimate kinase [Myxococcota bacterium]
MASARRARRDRALLLVGMMGAGKSTVGRALANRLGWRFIDSDASVEAARGLPIEEIFAAEGAESFRALEAQVLRELPDREAVVALGGGAVLAPENRELLRRKGVIVWLDASPEILAARIGSDAARPLLAGTDGSTRIERLRQLCAERAAAYACADLRVPTDGLSVAESCGAVLAALGWEVAA